MRHPVTDIALLAYIAKKKVDVLSYTDATRACKSSSSASRALHQLIKEGLLDPQPRLLGLRYVTQYVVTDKGKQVAQLALQLTQLREVAARAASSAKGDEEEEPENTTQVPQLSSSVQVQTDAVGQQVPQKAEPAFSTERQTPEPEVKGKKQSKRKSGGLTAKRHDDASASSLAIGKKKQKRGSSKKTG